MAGSDNVKSVFATAAVSFAADQAAKAAAIRAFGGGGSVTLVPGVLDLRLVLNRGAAWGMLAGRRWLLCAVSAAMLAMLFCNRRELCATRLSRVATGLLSGGILGNLVDRVMRGGLVVDWIDVHWRSVWSFPVFNAADACISVGVALLLVSSLPWFRARR